MNNTPKYLITYDVSTKEFQPAYSSVEKDRYVDTAVTKHTFAFTDAELYPYRNEKNIKYYVISKEVFPKFEVNISVRV